MQYPRYSEISLREALQDTPVVLIHGSRQCGKTTLAQTVGKELEYHYISFDDDNQLQAAKADPVGFIKTLPEKIILDEVQRTPEIFTSLKASVDQSRPPAKPPTFLMPPTSLLPLPSAALLSANTWRCWNKYS